jgi:hypothetical protein
MPVRCMPSTQRRRVRKTIRTHVGTPPIAPGTPDVPTDAGRGMHLPHERDENHDTTAPNPDPVIVQARRDLDAGLVDTDLRTTPGLDAEQRQRLLDNEARESHLKSRRATTGGGKTKP